VWKKFLQNSWWNLKRRFIFQTTYFKAPYFIKKNDVCARGFLSYHGGMKVNQKKRRDKREEEYNKFVFYYY